MRKMRSYLYMFAALGIVALVVGLALGGHSLSRVMIKAGSGLSADGGGSASSYPYSAPSAPPESADAATPTAASAPPPAAYNMRSVPNRSSGVTEGAPHSTVGGGAADAPALGAVTGSSGTAGSSSAGAPLALAATPVAPSDRPADQKPQTPSDNQNPLRASEVDDDADYSAFLGYLQDKAGLLPANIAPNLAERYFVQVQNGQQRPVADASVEISSNGQTLWHGRTTSDGRVAFFPGAVVGSNRAQSFDVSVSRDQASAKAKLIRSQNASSTVVTLNTAPDNGVNLDVAFLIDSTGSMDDEIAKIKQSIHSIASRIGNLPANPHLRLALVTYRDRGSDNEYVTRKWDFTADVNTFQQELDTLVAYNGDDYPEDINAGLSDALNLPGWSQTNGHDLRLIFLVGDAPPHLDYTDEQQYPALSAQATAQGVKIFPIAASGLDDQGELIFREMAALTLGKFVFLTYAPAPNGAPGNGGNPGDTTTMHVGGYQTNNLDDVVVSLVGEEVANQTAPRAIQQSGATLFSEPDLSSIPPLTPQADLWPSLLPWLLALGWLPLLALALFAYRRNRYARLGPLPVRPARHESVPAADWPTLKALGPRALEASSPAVYIRPARYWATAVGEQATQQLHPEGLGPVLVTHLCFVLNLAQSYPHSASPEMGEESIFLSRRFCHARRSN